MFTIKKANNGEDPHFHHIACVSFVYSYYLNPNPFLYGIVMVLVNSAPIT